MSWLPGSFTEIKLFERDVDHSPPTHIDKYNKIQQGNKVLFHIYIKLNMSGATHRPLSGA